MSGFEVFPLTSQRLPKIEVKTEHDLYSLGLGKTATIKCIQCNSHSCTGHCGFIRLKHYIPHPIWYNFIPMLLQSRCRFCNKIYTVKHKYDSFSEYIHLIKNFGTCECEFMDQNIYQFNWKKKNSKFELEDNEEHIRIQSQKRSVKYTMPDAREMLQKFTKEEKLTLKINPEMDLGSLIVDYVVVLPPLLRPLNIGSTLQKDIASSHYSKIINSSSQIEIFNLYRSLVQKHKGKNHKLFKEFISGKTGLIRMNLLGTRNNRIARTVITTDSYIPVTHVGVPISFADSLTIFETIQLWNLQYILFLFDTNQVVETNNVDPKDLSKSIGKVIERKLRNDDWVFINRQPTLSHMSMLAFRVRLVESKTLVLNLAVTKVFNADFDGDEMTIYAASDSESQIECKYILSVTNNIYEGSRLLIKPIQDTISAFYSMTRSPRKLPRLLVYDLPPTEPLFKYFVRISKESKDPFSSDQVISYLLPENFCFSDPDVKIKNGVLISGIIRESNLSKIILALIKYNKDLGIQFLTECQTVADLWHKFFPLSISYSDTDLFSDSQLNDLKKIYTERSQEIHHLESIAESSPELASFCESRISNVLSIEVTGSLVKKAQEFLGDESKKSNPFVVMVDSGAKGNYLALTNIAAYLGQQTVNGRQLPLYGSLNSKSDPEHRGFVLSNYRTGLDFKGTYYQAAAGRQGIVNTGVGVTYPGVTYRLLWNFLSDIRIHHNHRVLSLDGKLIM